MQQRRDDFEDEDDFDTFMKHKKELEAKGLLLQVATNPNDDDYNSDQEVRQTNKKIVHTLTQQTKKGLRSGQIG